MREFYEKNKKMILFAAAGLFAMAVLGICAAPDAQAQYSFAGEDTFVVAGAKELMKIQTKVHVNGNGVTAGDLPSAYLLFSGDGSRFWVSRFDGAASEMGTGFPIPANSSIVMPAPPAFRLIDGNLEYRYYHYFAVNAVSVADSVHILPLK